MENAMITIITRQVNFQTGEEDTVTLATEAHVEQRGTGMVINYTESELSGQEGSHTQLIVEEDKLSMTREGTGSVEMIFEPGRHYSFSYPTPYGEIKMEMLTNKVEIQPPNASQNFRANIEYELAVNNLFQGKNHMEIEVLWKKNAED